MERTVRLQYTLNGYKWFSSAIDADIALTLARIVDEKGDVETVREVTVEREEERMVAGRQGTLVVPRESER